VLIRSHAQIRPTSTPTSDAFDREAVMYYGFDYAAAIRWFRARCTGSGAAARTSSSGRETSERIVDDAPTPARTFLSQQITYLTR
jgi:hypothetical protein